MVKIEYVQKQERVWISRDDSSYEAIYLTTEEWEMLIQVIKDMATFELTEDGMTLHIN